MVAVHGLDPKHNVPVSGTLWSMPLDPSSVLAKVMAVLHAFGADDHGVALAELQREGLIKEIGISNANVEEIQVAIDVLGDGGLAAVQNEFSPRFHHTSKPELDFCGERSIAFLPWSPLGGTGGGVLV